MYSLSQGITVFQEIPHDSRKKLPFCAGSFFICFVLHVIHGIQRYLIALPQEHVGEILQGTEGLVDVRGLEESDFYCQ